MTGRNPRLNASGCSDPTAYEALKPIIQEDTALERKVHSVIKTLKLIVDWAGFEFIGRIKIKHKESGKEFR